MGKKCTGTEARVRLPVNTFVTIIYRKRNMSLPMY